jgi:protease-4
MLNLYLVVLVAAQFDGGLRAGVIRRGQRTQTIAVYKIEGAIAGDAVRRFANFCDEVKHDRKVKAIVLRVNSPGGGVSASDQIHHLLEQLKETGKKVVVSMGGVAASGGYYISAGADEIIAEPTTITGSIGVVMAYPVIRGTLDKLGMDAVVIKSRHAGAWKDEGSWLQHPPPHQRKHLQEIRAKMQATFERVVLTGRGDRLNPRTVKHTIPPDETNAEPVQITETEPLNGKIYLPEEAKKLGLIDAIGYLTKAIDRAGHLAGLDRPHVIRYERRRSILAELMDSRKSSLLNLNVRTIDELQTPRVLLMWKAE